MSYPRNTDEELDFSLESSAPEASEEVSMLDLQQTKHVRDFVDRLKRLEEDKAAVAEDIKEVYGEAKAFGLDPKHLRKTVAKARKSDQERKKIEDEESILHCYLRAVGLA